MANITERSADIQTPVWTRPLQFHTGGVVKFWGPMECRKTSVMIAYTFNIIRSQGFPGSNVFANCWLDIPGAHWLRNDELRKVLRRAFNTEIGQGRWNKCIFLLMEADDVYSHITQADGECYRDIKTASQAYKRNQYLLWEMHDGKGVPKILRDKSEVSVRPYPDEKRDLVNALVCDGHYDITYTQPINRISAVNHKYRRFGELF